MRRVLGEAVEAVLDLVYPRHCAGCEAPLATTREPFLCGVCRAAVARIDRDRCLRCGRGLGLHTGLKNSCRDCRSRATHFRRAVAAAEFEGVWRRVLLRFKFAREQVLARPIAEFMVERLIADGIVLDGAPSASPLPDRWWIGVIDAFLPVPLGSKREWKRGFNQSAVLARECGRRLGIPVLEGALEREVETPSQVGQSRSERFANLAGAFRVRPKAREHVAGKRLCVVDDILTTGATASAVAHALKRAGAKAVFVAAAARKS
ncbi:MAG: ComF family protein [Planctomycetes bacterium]|nr:ComF family protein [Planctomycetota bacterium]